MFSEKFDQVRIVSKYIDGPRLDLVGHRWMLCKYENRLQCAGALPLMPNE